MDESQASRCGWEGSTSFFTLKFLEVVQNLVLNENIAERLHTFEEYQKKRNFGNVWFWKSGGEYVLEIMTAIVDIWKTILESSKIIFLIELMIFTVTIIDNFEPNVQILSHFEGER